MEADMAKLRGIDVRAIELYDIEHYCACIKELIEDNRNAHNKKD